MKVRSLSGKRFVAGAITATLIDGDSHAILTNASNEALQAPKDEVNRVIEGVRKRTDKGELKTRSEEDTLEAELVALWNRVHERSGQAARMDTPA
jgi:hypothetical protein